MVHFQGTEYRAHTSCMSEAQKYQGHLYRGDKKAKANQNQKQALVPSKAPEPTTTKVAQVNAPPKAPSPPPSGAELPPGVNVFDYMDTPAKIEPASFATPASKRDCHDKNKSDKKRKRTQEDQDTAEQTPALHSGLTGGLDRMLSGPEFGHSDSVAPSPLVSKKRSKKDKADSEAPSRQAASSVKSSSQKSAASSSNARQDKQQLATYRSPAEHFLSFVNKGPESDGGLSINKALKRYHRERQAKGEKDDGDKDLWKHLRIRKNDRGEYVLFI
jgi:cell growth-regulating nucleolar protein